MLCLTWVSDGARMLMCRFVAVASSFSVKSL